MEICDTAPVVWPLPKQYVNYIENKLFGLYL